MYLWNKVSNKHLMWAPSTSASDIKMILLYRTSSSSKVRPEPPPTTEIIDAHSAFFNTSATDAFWTFNIFPLIGSRAWNSEFLANFAVPNAESPSTMNNSVCSMSFDRQSASFAGSEDDSIAFFLLCTSR